MNRYRLAALVLVLGSSGAVAQEITGVFLGIAPDESRQIYTIEQPDSASLTIADFFGEQIEASVGTGGEISLVQGGELIVNNADDLSLTKGDGSQVQLQRVFSTDANFPFDHSPGPFTPHPVLADDQWNISEFTLDLLTGEKLRFADGSLEFRDVFRTIIRNDGGLRFADSVNVWFQGGMSAGDRAVFHSFNNADAAAAGTPQTLPPADNNFQRDVLGTAQFTDPNQFEVLLVLQDFNRDDLQQFLLTISGSRVNPLPAGDLDGDRLVGASDRDVLIQQYGTKPIDAGYNLAADLDGNRYISRKDLDAFDNTPVEQKRIGPWMSGLWFDPARDGEGFHLLVMNDEAAVVAWFTYRPEGGQAWVIGNAVITDNELIFDEIIITSGASFGAEFNPDDVLREQWGHMRMFFDGCDRGWVGYAGHQDFSNGGYPLNRLTQPVGLDCENETVDSSGDFGRYTGIWFDQAQNGAGWFVDELPNGQAAVTWFTYDGEGNQHWMVGSGPITGEGIDIAEVVSTSGAQFGAGFDPSDVVRTPWGSLMIDASCDQGTVTYDAVAPGFGSGQQGIVPLARVAGQGCQ